MDKHEINEILMANLAVPPFSHRRLPAVMHTVVTTVIVMPGESHVELVHHTAGQHSPSRQLLLQNPIKSLHLARIKPHIPRKPAGGDSRPVENPWKRFPGWLLTVHARHQRLPVSGGILRSVSEAADALPVDSVM
ncbi:hypothetical protein IEQ34_000261 [Dendrobium chrysotoxum]|uniref:Uncharacterized protein n=1 Tax=Dendrobium chrysotoxum TaxID=161865 RepID=A0AAV7HSN6_DENCH|nr:hypothetical protein IEQ34_000261 [Dendrobium chrysotoxum]